MARIKDATSTTTHIQVQIHPREKQKEDIDPTRNPIKTEEHTPHLKTTAGNISRNLFLFLFYLHLFLITILIIFLTIRGFVSATRTHHFHPLHWYPPLLTSSACAALVAFAWQTAACCNPSKTIRAAFWLSPSLTCAAGILLLSIGTSGSLAAAVLAIIFALVQSLYACWVVPRLDHATRVLSVSLSVPTAGTTSLIIISLVIGTIYSCFLLSGIGGATASRTHLDSLFVFVILLSLAWTMHVIRNVLHVAISRVAHVYNFTRGLEGDTRTAFFDTLTHSMGSVCLGSILVPVLGVLRGAARAMSSVAGDSDEFMFSFANCFEGVAGRLVAYGNRWGFVHVGVYGKGFVCASVDTWEMFGRVGMVSLIDSDLTGSFCFLCGVAGGSLCTLVGGSWALAVDHRYATEVSVYAFLIGYFMSRISMTWPQACVSAYFVVYAENPENLLLDNTIPDLIQDELQRSRS